MLSRRAATCVLDFMLAACLASEMAGSVEARPLFPAPLFQTAGPETVLAGDFNNDGIADLVTQAGILLGRGDGTFSPEAPYPAGTARGPAVIVDFDGDGWLDVAVVDRNAGTVSVLRGRGDGTLASVGTIGAGNLPNHIAIGDFNGDRQPDFVVVSEGTHDLALLLSDGAGWYLPASHFGFAAALGGVAVADFNHDGLDDIVVDAGTRLGIVYLGHGDGVFAQSDFLTIGDFVMSFAIADFDGDGGLDLACASSTGATLSIFRGNGDGTFDVLPASVAIPGTSAIIAADFNSDGHVDLVASGGNPGDISVVLGRGDGSFGGPVGYQVGDHAGPLAVADFDDNGALDLAAGLRFSKMVSVVLGRGDGTFPSLSRVTFNVLGAPMETGVADFDGDGRQDLAVTIDSGTVAVRLGQAPGGFTDPIYYDTGTLAPWPNALEIDDLNSDGAPDLVIGNRRANDVAVLLGAGDGTFAARTEYPTGADPRAVRVGDFDGDGFLDIVVANNASQDVSLLLGDGSGRFLPESRAPVAGGHPADLAAADFDGDGVDDVAVAGLANGNVGMMLARGGRLSAPIEVPSGGRVFGLVSADFDQDGKADLVGLTTNSAFTVLLGRGDGTFLPPVTKPAAVFSSSITIADFDADDRLDLVIANVGSDDVSIFLGDGLGGFAPESRYWAEDFPTFITAADVNADGNPDLTVVTANGLSIIPNIGPGDQLNSPPHATILAEATVECTGPAGAVVRLDGSGSFDPDSTPGTSDDIVSYEWFENPGEPGSTVLGSGQVLEISFPIGTHRIGLVVTDSKGATDTARTSVTVRDSQPPHLALTLSPSVLWPPNHRLLAVQTAWQVTDACDPAPQVVLASVTSSEPDDAAGPGDGSTTGDIQDASIGTPDTMVLLRAERSGDGPGRVYTLTCAARDTSGNTTSAVGIVTVPHDEGTGPEPVMLSLEGDGTPGMAHLYWNAVGGAEMYDVIQGDLGHLTVSNGEIWLGPVHVLAAGQIGTSYSEGPSGEIPTVGKVFLYLVQFREGQSASG